MKLFITISVLLFCSSQASAEWACKENERCQEYQSCILDGQISQCSYGSGSAVSGGVKFADGSDFFIEWVSSGDQDMELTLQEQGFALVDGVKTRFWQTEPDCVEFEGTDQKLSFGYGACSVGGLSNVFSCSLSPYEFNILRKGEWANKDWVAIKQGSYSEHYAQATLNTEGSGVCRYAIWSFELNGPMSVSTLGCYGEVLPPEGAVGEVILGQGASSLRFYCY